MSCILLRKMTTICIGQNRNKCTTEPKCDKFLIQYLHCLVSHLGVDAIYDLVEKQEKKC